MYCRWIIVKFKISSSRYNKISFGDGYSKVVTMFLMISILGIVNAQIMFAPRSFIPWEEDGLFFWSATKVIQKGHLLLRCH